MKIEYVEEFMKVSYDVLNKDNNIIAEFRDRMCFNNLERYYNNSESVSIKVYIDKIHVVNKDIVTDWLELVKKIVPSMIVSEDETYVILPLYPNSRGKVLITLTIIRYLWDSDWSSLYKIPLRTLNIIKRLPSIDPLKAIIMASTGVNSNTNHSLIMCLPESLKTIEDFKTFDKHRVYDFCSITSKKYFNASSDNITCFLNENGVIGYDIDFLIEYFKDELKEELKRHNDTKQVDI